MMLVSLWRCDRVSEEKNSTLQTFLEEKVFLQAVSFRTFSTHFQSSLFQLDSSMTLKSLTIRIVVKYSESSLMESKMVLRNLRLLQKLQKVIKILERNSK